MPSDARIDPSEIRRRLLTGQPIDFGERPQELADQEWQSWRTVEAQWLTELISDQRTIRMAISLTRAYLSGVLECPLTTFAAAVTIRDCDVAEAANFSGCRFLGPLDITNSRWQSGLSLDSAEINGSFTAEGSRIFRSASFMRTLFKDGCVMKGGRFWQARFNGANFLKDAQFSALVKDRQFVPTRFFGLARFIDAKFSLLADFGGARFYADADFARVDIAGTALFRWYEGNPLTGTAIGGGKGARIYFRGQAIFRYANLQGGADFAGACFLSNADFAFLRVNGAAFFGTPKPQAAGVTFRRRAEFNWMQVAGRLVFEAGRFRDDALFEGLQVTGNALLRGSATSGIQMRFEKRAVFLDAVVSGTVDFNGALFGGDAVFTRMRVGGGAFFRSLLVRDKFLRTEFQAPAFFIDSSFLGVTTFEGTSFRLANFRRAQFSGIAYFSSIGGDNGCRTKFDGDADFRNTRFSNTAYFRGVSFDGAVNFSDVEFARDAYFGAGDQSDAENAVGGRFRGVTTFERARIGGSADFLKAIFSHTSPANFSGARVAGDLHFQQTTFDAGAWFNFSEIGGDFFLSLDAPDRGPALLQVNGTTIKGALAMTGATIADKYTVQFGTLSVGRVALESSMTRRLAKRCDVQTLLQFEKAYRSTGEDTEADLIFLRRRGVERMRNWNRLWSRGTPFRQRTWALGMLITDVLPWAFRYGQPALRLFVVAVFLFLSGVALLSQEGALEPVAQPTAAGAGRQSPSPILDCSDRKLYHSLYAMAAASIGGDSLKRLSRCEASTSIVAPVLNCSYALCTTVLAWLVVIFFSLFVAGYARLFKFKG